MGNMFKCTLKSGGASGTGIPLIVTCSDDFAGKTITATDGTTTLTETCPSASPYTVQFDLPNTGTWTISGTVSGQSYSVQVSITDYSAVLNRCFDWQGWVDSSVDLDSSDYQDLDEVLADEKAVMELMLVHASVDFLAASNVDSDVEKIIKNDLCAKWINLSDYALDTLYAVNDIKTVMDEADKYGYGEWCLMPQVPTMTSNTAPYGEASASSEGDASAAGKAYKAFDGDTTTGWVTSNQAVSASNIWIRYDFLNPICVKQFEIALFSNVATMTVKVQGSNTGNSDDWHDCSDEITGNSTLWSVENKTKVSISNSEFYSKYRLFIVSETNNNSMACGRIITLQFYAYAPKGAVPKMTSNSAPYGEAIAAQAMYSGQEAYKAFDGDITTWASCNTSATDAEVGYKFTNPVNVKRVYIGLANAADYTDGNHTYKVQYSDDNSTYTDCSDDFKTLSQANPYIDVEDFGYHIYWRVKRHSASAIGGILQSLQFYGRQLSVSVPVMTSNTAPFGEVVKSTEASNLPAWKVFDNDNSTQWNAEDSTNQYVGYEFDKPVVVKKFMFIPTFGSQLRVKNFKLQGHDGSAWQDIYIGILSTNAQSEEKVHIYDVNNENAYSEYRLFVVDNYAGGSYATSIKTLQFYGLDYSEKEFEAGSNKKWLYDHGVQIEPMSGANGSSGVAPVFGDDSVVVQSGSASSNAYSLVYNTTAFDLTPYNIIRAKISNQSGGRPFIATGSTPTGSETVQRQQAVADMPNNLYLDISSVDQRDYCIFNMGSGSNGICEWLEMWLEP